MNPTVLSTCLAYWELEKWTQYIFFIWNGSFVLFYKKSTRDIPYSSSTHTHSFHLSLTHYPKVIM